MGPSPVFCLSLPVSFPFSVAIIAIHAKELNNISP